MRDTCTPEWYPTLHVLAFRIVGKVLFIELRTNGAREQGVAADAVFAECNSGALHEGCYTGFCRGIVRLKPTADEGRDAREANDGAARGRLLSGHMPGGGLNDIEGAIEVDANCVAEEVRFHGQEFGELADSRVADADIEAATEPGDGVAHKSLAGLRIAHITRQVLEGAGGERLLLYVLGLGDQGLEVWLISGEVL